MEFDFTALNHTGRRSNLPTGAGTTTSQGADFMLTRKQEERERYRQVYATYQQNIGRAGALRSEIAKGLETGTDPTALLLKALECISLMTGDSTLYTNGKADLLTIYGWGLGEKAPLELELKEARERLAKLEHAEQAQLPEGQEKNRLQTAIQAHRELIQKLEQAIGV